MAGVLLARPALAQVTADLVVTLASPVRAKSVGQSVDYKATIVNQGISHAHGVVLTGTLPAGAELVSSDAGCVQPTPPDGTFTCSLGEIGDATTGATPVVVTIAVAPGVPDPLPATLADCANAAALGNLSVQVSTTTTDVNAANDSATAAVQVVPYTDLSIDVAGPGTVAESSTATYDVTVTNNGPCPAANVVVQPDNVFPVVSSTGACTAFPPDPDSGAPTCALGTLDVGQSVQFQSAIETPGMPNEINGSSLTAGFSVASATYDPNSGNDAASTTANMDLSSSGCSSGGAGGLFALASLLALRFRRRRIA